MPLEPTAAWIDAASGENDPVALLSVYDGSTTWQAVDKWPGHSDLNAVDQGLVEFTPLSEEVDPFTREVEIGSMTIEVADKWIRPIVVNNVLFGRRARLQLGFVGLASSDYLTIFTGSIEEPPHPRPGGQTVTIECLGILAMLARVKIAGYWANKHPLEIGEDILEKAGLPAAMIDYDALDPSGVGHEVFSGSGLDDLTKGGSWTGAGASTFAITIDATGATDTFTWTKDGAGGATGVAITESAQALSDGVTVTFAAKTGHTVDDQWTIECSDELDAVSHFCTSYGVRNGYTGHGPMKCGDAMKQLNAIGALVNGAWGVNANGQVTFRMFDSSRSAEDHWDDASIDDLEQLEDVQICNECNVLWRRNGDEHECKYTQEDTDSQSSFAFPGTSERVFSEKIETRWLDYGHARLGVALTDVATSTSSGIGNAHGWTGGRWPGYPSVAQPEWCKISAARPAYLRFVDRSDRSAMEIVKVTSASPSGQQMLSCVDPDDGELIHIGPYPRLLTINTMVRGQLGTAGVAHVAQQTDMYDITIPYFMAATRIARFGGGAAKVKVITPISKAWLTTGDLVTIEHEPYLDYGLDGIDSGDGKWEITRKEIVLYGAEPHCEFLLTSAIETSPSTSHSAMDAPYLGVVGNMLDETDQEFVGERHVPSGLVVTQDAGLVGDISAGTITNGVVSAQVPDISHTFTASKDTYVVVSLLDGSVSFYETALAAGRPTFDAYETEIAKVVTGAAAIGSVDTSEKPTTAVDGAVLHDATVDTTQLASLAVTAAKIGALAVTTAKIANYGVTAPKIALANIYPYHLNTNGFTAFLDSGGIGDLTIGNGSWTKVTCDGEEYDDGEYDADINYRFVASVEDSERWRFSAYATLDNLDSGSFVQLALYKNGSAIRYSSTIYNASGLATRVYVNADFGEVVVAMEDYFELYILHDDSGNCTLKSAADASMTWFEGHQVKGS